MLQEEDLLQAKDAKIAELREQLSHSETSPGSMADTHALGTSPSRSTASSHERIAMIHSTSSVRCGKAPPVEAFTGDEATVHWDHWLLTLE